MSCSRLRGQPFNPLERSAKELELLRVLALPIDSKVALADSLRDPDLKDFTVNEQQAVRGETSWSTL